MCSFTALTNEWERGMRSGKFTGCGIGRSGCRGLRTKGEGEAMWGFKGIKLAG